ncbi:HNH endonuclease [Bradyrhizobium lablabi]|nr:HNH endonuclease signature motif containing protein [Bradyrhizobium lablabi]
MSRPRLGTADTRRIRPPPKQAADHYSTPEHRAWRTAVVERAGGQCQWPGCGRSGVRLFADHIVEIKDGGSALDLANGQALCGGHHTAKTMRARARRMAAPPPV